MQFHRLQRVVKQVNFKGPIFVGFIVGSYRDLDNNEIIVCQDMRSRQTWFAKEGEILPISDFVERNVPTQVA